MSNPTGRVRPTMINASHRATELRADLSRLEDARWREEDARRAPAAAEPVPAATAPSERLRRNPATSTGKLPAAGAPKPPPSPSPLAGPRQTDSLAHPARLSTIATRRVTNREDAPR